MLCTQRTGNMDILTSHSHTVPFLGGTHLDHLILKRTRSIPCYFPARDFSSTTTIHYSSCLVIILSSGNRIQKTISLKMASIIIMYSEKQHDEIVILLYFERVSESGRVSTVIFRYHIGVVICLRGQNKHHPQESLSWNMKHFHYFCFSLHIILALYLRRNSKYTKHTNNFL